MPEHLRLMDGAGRDLAAWVVGTNAAAAALLAGIVAVDLLLRRRVSASRRQVLYVLLALRVVLPFGWPGIFSNSGFAPERAAAGWAGVTYSAAGRDAPAHGQSGEAAAVAEAAPSRWGVVVALTYGAVAALLAARCGRGYARLRREIEGRGTPVQTEHGVRVVEHPTLGPMVAGVWRPVVVLPRGFELAVGAERAAWVLRHELNHIARMDPLAAFATRVACVTFWPVLPLWIGAARVRALMEQACDERTVLHGDRVAYAEALLTVASRTGTLRPAAGLAFGQGARSRIAALAAGRRWSGLAQGLAVCCALLVLGACAGEGPRSHPETSQTEGPAAAGARITLEARVLGGVPAGAGLEAGGGDAWTVIVGPDEAARIVALAESNPATATRSSPRIVVLEDQPARIMVGAELENGELKEGIELNAKANRRGDATELTLRFRERSGGDPEIDVRAINVVPDGRVLLWGVKDAAGTRSRVIMIRASAQESESAAAAPAEEAPSFLTMVNIMNASGYLFPDAEPLAGAGGSSARRLLVRRNAAGTLLIGPDDPASRERVKGAWAVVASDGDVLRMMDTLRGSAGASVSAVPAIITESGQRGRVGMTDQDKAHAPVGRILEVTCDAVEGGVLVSFEGQGASRVSVEGVTLPAGDSLLIFVGQDAGPHEVYAVRPSALERWTRRVYQTTEPTEKPGR